MHRAAQGLHELAHDRQSQAAPARVLAARRIEAGEALEDPGPVGGGDAGAVVADGQQSPRPVVTDLDGHTGPRIALRVAEEVLQHARERVAVRLREHLVRRIDELYVDAASR